ncbi:MAG: MATE family efflux transporter [Phycisphaerales bacterium]|nr:MATE family efflux transporter [Phycisphaerales bacterium]
MQPTIGTLPPGSVNRQVVVLALPMLGEQLLSYMVGLVDTLLAGHISKEAIAAVGTGSYLGWMINLTFALVGVGAAAIISRSVGARDEATTHRALHQGAILGALLGFVACIASYFAADSLAGFLTNTPSARQLCAQFIRIIAPGYLLASFNMVGSAMLRAAGDTVTPLRIMAVVNVVNAAVSAALVFGGLTPQLGVTGIGIGFVTARSIGGILMAVVLFNGVRGLRIRPSGLRVDWEMMKRVLRIGIPAAGDTMLMSIAQLTFVKIIAMTGTGDVGTANFAAHVVAVEVEGLSYMPALAWGTAAATLVGQYLGAGRPVEATRAGHLAAMQGAALGLFSGAVFLAFAEQIYAMFTSDPAVRHVGIPAFRLMAFAQPFLCTAIVYIQALRGAGDTRMTMIFALIGGIGLRIPIAYLGGVVLQGGLIGAWCGMWADNLAKFLLGLARFLHGGWRRIRT